jgi:hypothetical protein
VILLRCEHHSLSPSLTGHNLIPSAPLLAGTCSSPVAGTPQVSPVDVHRESEAESDSEYAELEAVCTRARVGIGEWARGREERAAMRLGAPHRQDWGADMHAMFGPE